MKFAKTGLAIAFAASLAFSTGVLAADPQALLNDGIKKGTIDPGEAAHFSKDIAHLNERLVKKTQGGLSPKEAMQIEHDRQQLCNEILNHQRVHGGVGPVTTVPVAGGNRQMIKDQGQFNREQAKAMRDGLTAKEQIRLQEHQEDLKIKLMKDAHKRK